MSTRPRRLQHYSSRGTRRDWVGAKLKSQALSNAYRALDAKTHGKRADRVAECANRLEFERVDGQLELRRAWRCMHRLCAVCAALNSRKDFAILMGRMAEHANRHPFAAPILVTLSMPNVTPANLKGGITHLLGAYRRLLRMPVIKRAVMGSHRSLEITVNKKRGDFHPHLHCIMQVGPDARAYFRKASPLYLTHERWLALWQKATGLDLLPNIHVQRLGRSKRDGTFDLTADGLFEAVKYCLKPDGWLDQDETGAWRIDPDLLRVVHDAVHRRRLRDLGGSLRKIRTADLPNQAHDRRLAEAHAHLDALEAYAFGDWVEPDTGEILTDYWQRAPPEA